MKVSKVQRELFMIGLTPRHKGFYYLCDAVFAKANNPDASLISLISADEDDSMNVIRCMRYAIQYAWDVSTGSIHELFPNYSCPPTPIELINVMLWSFDDCD